MKHCLCRGYDINNKKPPLAAWNLVTRPKSEGGLGIRKIVAQNDALLLKNLHKFFNQQQLPWVQLLLNNYYSGNIMLGQKKRFFLVKRHIKIIGSIQRDQYSTNFRWKNTAVLGRHMEWENTKNGISRAVFFCTKQST